MSEEDLQILSQTPASAFGSCRYKLKNWKDDETDYKKILHHFEKLDVGYFLYNGGNDSQDTTLRIYEFAKNNNTHLNA